MDEGQLKALNLQTGTRSDTRRHAMSRPCRRPRWRWLRQPALPVLLTLIVISSAIWGFIEVTDEVLEGDTASFDQSLLLALRTRADTSDPLGPRWLEEMGRDMTALGGIGVLTLTTLGVTGYLLLTQKRRLAVVVLVASVGALGVSSALKYGIDRSRPDLVPHGSVVYTKSFPSGHSMQAAATYLTLAALLGGVQRKRRNMIYLLSLALLVTGLVGVSRVYLGVHWPTDVLAGWIAGGTWALLCWLLARWLQGLGQVECEDGEAARRLDERAVTIAGGAEATTSPTGNSQQVKE